MFGFENVGVFFFEDYRNKEGEMVKGEIGSKLEEELNSFLNLSNQELRIAHYNEALPSNKITNKAKLNKTEPHDLGNHLLESPEKHRIKKYLEEDLKFYEKEETTYSDVLIKRKHTEKAISSDNSLPINYAVDNFFLNELKNFYEKGNQNLKAIIQKDIPGPYLNLIL